MGKSSKRQDAEQAREFRLKREQEEREKQKRQNRIIMWSIVGVLAVALVIAGIALIITNVKKKAPKDGPIIADPDPNYTEAAETTEYVKLTITYTDGKGVSRQGDVIVHLLKDDAPITVANFQKLVSQGFYNGLTFHRVLSGFMIQGGDPDGDGTGGSSETIKGEFSVNGVNNPLSHKRGVISMARSTGYDSASSQFFIMHQDYTGLDGEYAAFGNVVSGMDTVDGIAGTEVYQKVGAREKCTPVNPVTIVSAVFVQPKG